VRRVGGLNLFVERSISHSNSASRGSSDIR
jgi:hypothetical protein